MPLSRQILIVDYDPQWPELYEREAGRIRAALGCRTLRVGSRSVPHLVAKSIINILLVVADSADEATYLPALEASVSTCTFFPRCPEIDRMLMFRDWLRGNVPDRALYAHTKTSAGSAKWKDVSRITPMPRPW